MNRIHLPRLILLTALALAWVWDMLFYGKALGISVLLFTLLLLVALFGLSWLGNVRPSWRNLWLVIPLIFFATMIFVRANPFLTFLNVVIGLVLLGLLAYFFASGWIEKLELIGYPLVSLQIVKGSLSQAPPVIAESANWQFVRKRGRHNLFPLFRGCLLSLPILAIFTCFLASADMVFAGYLEDLTQLEFLPDLLEWIWRGIIILIIGFLLTGSLAYALKRSQLPGNEYPLKVTVKNLTNSISLGLVEVTTLLISVNLLFLVFVWIQFTYLFGGQTNVVVDGYTYAEYARRGFFELLTLSILSLGLILALNQLVRRRNQWQTYIFKSLSSLMVGLVLVILASAFQRLLLYEAAFGYTQLRLYSHVFMVWLAIVFIWFLVTLWLRPHRFAIGVFVAMLGFFITLNVINPDAFIARQNLTRYHTTGKLDVTYLTTLSDDVVPVLFGVEDQLTGDNRQTLTNHMYYRLERMEEKANWQIWSSYHLARWQAYELLTQKYHKKSG